MTNVVNIRKTTLGYQQLDDALNRLSTEQADLPTEYLHQFGVSRKEISVLDNLHGIVWIPQLVKLRLFNGYISVSSYRDILEALYYISLVPSDYLDVLDHNDVKQPPALPTGVCPTSPDGGPHIYATTKTRSGNLLFCVRCDGLIPCGGLGSDGMDDLLKSLQGKIN